MLAITYPMKRKRIKVAKWGTPKNISIIRNQIFYSTSALQKYQAVVEIRINIEYHLLKSSAQKYTAGVAYLFRTR
jgi:hypothetical protein